MEENEKQTVKERERERERGVIGRLRGRCRVREKQTVKERERERERCYREIEGKMSGENHEREREVL
jgi:hypothetical protein